MHDRIAGKVLIFLIITLFSLACLRTAYADPNSPVTFTFQNLDVKQALFRCAAIAGVHVEIDPQIKGTVTIDLVAVPFVEAVRRIAAQTGLVYQWQGVVLVVSMPQATIIDIPVSPPASAPQSSSPTTGHPGTAYNPVPGVIMTSGTAPYPIKLKYSKPDNLKIALGAVIPDDRIRIEPAANVLIITATPEEYRLVEPLIALLDQPPKQILFEAEVVEVAKTDLKQLGISWEWTTYPAPANAADNGMVGVIKIDPARGYNLNYRANIQALYSDDRARILAKPRVTALDGQTARILIGDKLPVETRAVANGIVTSTISYIDVGIKLEVTPRANEGDILTIHIRPEVSTNIAPTGSNPSIRTREAETTVRVKTGDTIVLGGLIQSESRKKIAKLPLLGDLPLVGGFFKQGNTELKETELVIFITPRLVESLSANP